MTAKAPPPLASQLTERYSGLAFAIRLVSSYTPQGGRAQWAHDERGAFLTDLDQVGVPSIATDSDVVIAELLPRRLSEDVSCGPRLENDVVASWRWLGWGKSWWACSWGGNLRYLDDRTKRPAMIADMDGRLRFWEKRRMGINEHTKEQPEA